MLVTLICSRNPLRKAIGNVGIGGVDARGGVITTLPDLRFLALPQSLGLQSRRV